MAVQVKIIDENENELQINAIEPNHIVLTLNLTNVEGYQTLCFNKSDAIKVAKELRKQINIINTNFQIN